MGEISEKPELQTFEVEVRQRVRVTLDPLKFTPAFLSDFRKDFFPLYGLDEHACHIAQLAAREQHSFSRYIPKEFVEGYGMIGEMGITAEVLDCEEDVLHSSP